MAAGPCTRARFWGTGEKLLNFESSYDQRACAISRGSERAATARTQHILESEESYDAELEERGDRPHRTSRWPWAKAAGLDFDEAFGLARAIELEDGPAIPNPAVRAAGRPVRAQLGSPVRPDRAPCLR